MLEMNFFCYGKIRLHNGYIGLQVRVFDVSSRGARLQIPYQASVDDTIHLIPHYETADVPQNKKSADITVVVKWSKNNGAFGSDVGCEVADPNLNLLKCLLDWKRNSRILI